MSRINEIVRRFGASTLILALFLGGCEATSDEMMGPEVAPLLTVTVDPATSPFTGPVECRAGFGAPQCHAQPFGTTNDLAYAGNGFALPAVSRDVIPGHSMIHRPEFANDGFYGNGASWISNSAGSWVKIDLGRVASIDGIKFGRDRTGSYNDRDPGQFTVSIASSDDLYANGADNNDVTEYTQVLDSYTDGFGGAIHGSETVVASFAPMVGRYVKLTVTTRGAAVDEIEVMGVVLSPPEVTPIAAMTVLTGERYFRIGSFSDPDPGETWTGTVDYGEGSGEQPLAIVYGNKFVLDHTYQGAGTFTVTVTVGDGVFITTATTQAIVATPAQGVALVQLIWASLTTNPAPPARAPTPMNATLGAAHQQYDRGNYKAGNGQMGAFKNQVDARVRSRRLDADDGQELNELSDRVITAATSEAAKKPGKGRGR